VVKITPEHREASRLRACGLNYHEIAAVMRTTPDRVSTQVREYCRVIQLQLAAEQEDADGEENSG